MRHAGISAQSTSRLVPDDADTLLTKQKAATSPRTASPAQQMRRDLEALAARLGATFVVEGQPIRPASKPITATPATAASENEALAAVRDVAAAYDYEVAQLPRGGGRRNTRVYALRKRYTRTDDFPLLTIPEMERSLARAQRLMEPYRPNPPVDWNTDLAIDIFRLLDADQRRQLPDNTLRVRMLRPPQKAAMWRFCLHVYVGSMADAARHAQFWVRRSPKLTLSNAADLLGVSIIGARGIDPGKPDEWNPLPNNMPMPKDMTDDGPTGPPPIPQWDDGACVSVGQLAARLNASKPALPFVADPVIADKRVMVVGGERSGTAEDVWAAAARVCGLHVTRQPKDGTPVLKMTLPPEPAPCPLPDLNAAVSRTFPEPLLRTLHSEECAALHKLPSGLSRPDQDARAFELDSRPVVLHARALRFLHDDIAASSAATMVRVNGTRPGGKPMLDINPLETSAFLLAVLADYTEYAQWAQRTPSQVVTDFDNAFVIGNEYEEKGVRKLSIGLGIWDPLGKRVVPEMSIFGINAAGHKGGPLLAPL